MSDREDDDRALASTAVSDDPARSPSQQVLHDDVKQALFSGRKLEYEPGTVLAGRYRVVALLGRGGMGEVYRARDLIVDEDVAIKFLPARLAERPAYLERFVQEVRLARQVSHPNVCRVHDIGEADGRRFISMEYIDGEDLASLLRRIGRLGHDKAIELAHQLCSGLAALHERGMIHRDLKPANVMLDGKGQIRIADFGLASVAAELREDEFRDGTPAYQAPEQIEGREVTARSDVYAVGLVLHEMFLGRRPDDAPDGGTALSGLAPEVSEVIGRCLEEDPLRRPASALEVAATLPGGDPLSAALAAGRMPSPEAVANAATVGGLSRRAGWLLLSLTTLATFLVAALGGGSSALSHSGELLQPEVLEHRVTEVLQLVGYNPDFRGGDLVRLEFDQAFLESLAEQSEPGKALEESEYSAVVMRYRGYPILRSTESTQRAHEAALVNPLETEVIVDGRGRLRGLTRVPLRKIDAPAEGTTGGDTEEGDDEPAPPPEPAADPEPAPAVPYDWGPLLQEAGLEEAALHPITPTRRPPVYADALQAWDGSVGDVPVRVHAASLGERPVWFDVERTESGANKGGEEDFLPIVALFFVLVVIVLLIVTLRTAVTVLRRKEGDFTGARKIAYAAFGLQVLYWLCNAQGSEILDFGPWLLLAGGTALAAWLGYLILEPHARANWPHSLVSWTRFLQGRWRDPMVGRDLLVATALGVTIAFAMPVAEAIIDDNTVLANHDLGALLGVRRAVGVVVGDARDSVAAALVLYIVLLSLQSVVRSRVVALILFIGVVPLMVVAMGQASVAVGAAIILTGFAFVMIRYGLLALVVLNVIHAIAYHFPITANIREWWAPTGLLGAVLILTPAILGYILATAPTRKAARTATTVRR